MKVEQDHIVMSGRYGEQKGDVCYGHMAMSWKRDMRESGKMKDFLFYFFLIESPTFIIF